jgi:hypothetical protein
MLGELRERGLDAFRSEPRERRDPGIHEDLPRVTANSLRPAYRCSQVN